MLKLKNAEAGYIAGLIDGEGYIGIRASRRGTKLQPIISVNNANEQAIRYLHKKLSSGSVSRFKFKLRSHNKDTFLWQTVSPKEIEDILRTILPYLIIKEQQASVVLEFIKEKTDRRQILLEKQKRDKKFQPFKAIPIPNKDFQYYLKLKELNRRGKKDEP